MDGEVQVTVVVIGNNGAGRLERCLSALAATADVAFETVVVGADPARRGGDWIAAASLAIAGSRGAYLAFLAGHALVEPRWLRSLVDALASDASIGAACSTLHWRDQPELLCADGGRLTWLGIAFDGSQSCLAPDPGAAPTRRETSFPTIAAMLIGRRDWEAAGGFDPAFRAGNADADLGWRLWLAGRRVVVCSDSVVRSEGSQVDAGERPHGWVGAARLRQTIRMLLKHYPPRFLLHALHWSVRARVASGAWRSLVLALAWNLAHLPATLLRRRRIQRTRRTAHEELFARGVLLELAEPPRPPTVASAGAISDAAEWIPSAVLLPGADSALGRLGAGWFPAAVRGGVQVRAVAATARCSLRVASAASGVLQAHLRLPEQAADGDTVTVSCNGASAACPGPGGEWRRVDLPVQARHDGLLEVELRTPAWQSAAGATVRELRFVPDDPRPSEPPATISVIIPTFNRWTILAEALAALGSQTMREFEVIVVDDGSSDGTWDSLAAWRRSHPEVPLKAVRQPNLKPGRARNRGLRDATGDLVLFLGDDIIPQPDFLAQHLAKHQEVGEDIGVLGLTEWDRARMNVTPFLEFVNGDGPQFAYSHFRDGGDIFFTGFYTSNISLPRRVLGTDPFHPAFTFVDWEDVELGYRLSLRGLRLIYHAGARAAHYHPTSIRQFYRRQKHVGRTIGVILGLHPELATSPAMPPLEPAPWFGWARRVAPALIPLLELWDRRGGRCPLWLYRNLLLCAFWTGRLQGLTATGPAGTGGAASGTVQ